MTNVEKLQHIVLRARKMGYPDPEDVLGGFQVIDGKLCTDVIWEALLYDHDFAKWIFPKGWTCFKDGQWQDCEWKQQFLSDTPFVYPKWQYHLMQMVISDSPIHYAYRVSKFTAEGHV